MFKVLDVPFSGTRLEGLTRSTTICEYRGDTNSSGQLIDYSGKSHHLSKTGTINSTAGNIQDQFGNKIRTPYYPSGLNYFSCATHSDFNCFDGDFTITLIANTLGTAAYNCLFSRYDVVGGIMLYCIPTSSKTLALAMYKASYAYVQSFVTLVNPELPNVYQFVRSSNSVTAYAPGITGTPVACSGYGIDCTASAFMGSLLGGAGNAQLGIIPYLRIDTEALSATELAFERNYLTGCTIGTPGMFSSNNSVLSYNKKYWTFTRASTAYNKFNDGSLALTPAGLPRIGDDKALLVEPAATNIALQSETISEFREVRPDGDVNLNWVSCALDDDGTNIIVGSESKLFTSNDSGATWTQRNPSGSYVSSIWYSCSTNADGSKLIAGAFGKRLWTSTDSGANWTERRPGGVDSDYNWQCTGSSSDGTILAAGVRTGRLWTSNDSGATWTERRPGGVDADFDWRFCKCSSTGLNLIVGQYNGRLYTGVSADGGATYTWTERKPGGVDADKKWYMAATDSDGSNLMAGVNIGRLWTSSDSGANWTERRPSGVDSDATWLCLGSDADGSNLIAGAYLGRLWLSTDSGVTWTERRPTGSDSNTEWRSASLDSAGNNIFITNINNSVRLQTSAWYKKSCASISDNGSISPNGTTTMDGIIGDTTDTTHGITQFQTLTAASYTFSGYAKKGDKDWIYLGNSTVANCYSYFNISTGVIGTKGAGCASAIIESASNGIYRCSITFTGTVAAHTLQAFAANADGDNDFAGDAATVNTWFWGMQCELCKHRTSYIPTTTASVIRNSDATILPISSISNMPINISSTTQFTKLIVELEAKTYFSSNATSSGNCALYEISGNSGTAASNRNRIRGVIGSDGYISSVLYDNTSTLFLQYINVINPCIFSNWNKYYFYLNFTQFSNSLIKLNGAILALATYSGTPIFDMTNCSLRINNDYVGTSFESVNIKNLKIWLE